MITEDYCNFEIAKLLQEKGFDGVCRTAYETISNEHEVEQCSPSDWGKLNQIKRPTLQMAMKWLREMHHCVICITPLTFYCGEIVSKWGYCIWADDNTEVDEESSPKLDSYEEACEEAIKYCLENLI